MAASFKLPATRWDDRIADLPPGRDVDRLADWVTNPDGYDKLDDPITAAALNLDDDEVTVQPEDAYGAVLSLGDEPADEAAPPDLTRLRVVGYPHLFRQMALNEYAREEMPVIEPEDATRFVRWLKGRGIGVERRDVDPVALSGSQNELNGNKVVSILQSDEPATGEPPIVSADGRVLDGHHRQSARALQALRREAIEAELDQLRAELNEAHGS